MQFTYVDAIVAVVVLLSALLAYSRGFTREVLAIIGWVAAGFAAFYFAPMLEPIIRELPVVGPFLAESCVISMIVAFSLVVAAVLLVLAVFMPVFASVVLESALGPIDRVLGFLFGVARGLLLLVIGYLIYGYLSVGNFEQALADGTGMPETGIAALDQSASKKLFDDLAQVLNNYRPKEMPGWFSERIDALMSPCGGDPADAPDPAETPATAPTTGGTDS
ncbi:MAG: CvpA family protein [Pseudomonadota bacterium]